jgi:hypothetical protein
VARKGILAMIGKHAEWDERVKRNIEALKKRKEPKVVEPPPDERWGQLLLDYVRRDSEEFRERWRSQ